MDLHLVEAYAALAKDAELQKKVYELREKYEARVPEDKRVPALEQARLELGKKVMAEINLRETESRMAAVHERLGYAPMVYKNSEGKDETYSPNQLRQRSEIGLLLQLFTEKAAEKNIRLDKVQAVENYVRENEQQLERARAYYLVVSEQAAQKLEAAVAEGRTPGNNTRETKPEDVKPVFSPKDIINIEIFAEKQADPEVRARFTALYASAEREGRIAGRDDHDQDEGPADHSDERPRGEQTAERVRALREASPSPGSMRQNSRTAPEPAARTQSEPAKEVSQPPLCPPQNPQARETAEKLRHEERLAPPAPAARPQQQQQEPTSLRENEPTAVVARPQAGGAKDKTQETPEEAAERTACHAAEFSAIISRLSASLAASSPEEPGGEKRPAPSQPDAPEKSGEITKDLILPPPKRPAEDPANSQGVQLERPAAERPGGKDVEQEPTKSNRGSFEKWDRDTNQGVRSR